MKPTTKPKAQRAKAPKITRTESSTAKRYSFYVCDDANDRWLLMDEMDTLREVAAAKRAIGGSDWALLKNDTGALSVHLKGDE